MRNSLSQPFLLGLVILATSLNQSVWAAITVNSFDDIVSWTGSGANRAALVIDWADNRDPLVWGYRFDTATGADMLQAVVQADSRLYAKVQPFSFGWFVHGLGYDRNNNGFAISSGTDFGSTGFLFSGDYDDALSTDANDSYRETDGAFFNSWAYWNGSGNDYPLATWAAGNTGISDRALSNNDWDGFQFNTLGFGNGTAPGIAFAAIPEPHAATWLILTTALLPFRRRREC